MDGMTMMTNALLKTLGLSAQDLTNIRAEFNVMREQLPVYAGALKTKVESMDARIASIEETNKAIFSIVKRMESQMDSVESRLIPYSVNSSLFEDALKAASQNGFAISPERTEPQPEPYQE